MFIVLEDRYCYIQFTDKKTKAQRGKVTQRSHIAHNCQSDLQPRPVTLRPLFCWSNWSFPSEREPDTPPSLETGKIISSFLLSYSTEPCRNHLLKFLNISHGGFAIIIKLANGQLNKSYIKVVHNGSPAFLNKVHVSFPGESLCQGKRGLGSLPFFPGRTT